MSIIDVIEEGVDACISFADDVMDIVGEHVIEPVSTKIRESEVGDQFMDSLSEKLDVVADKIMDFDSDKYLDDIAEKYHFEEIFNATGMADKFGIREHFEENDDSTTDEDSSLNTTSSSDTISKVFGTILGAALIAGAGAIIAQNLDDGKEEKDNLSIDEK